MKILFDDEDIMVQGRRVRMLDLAEGQRVVCGVEGEGTYLSVRLKNGKAECEGFDLEDWGEVIVLTRKYAGVEERPIRQEIAHINGIDYTVTAICECTRTSVWLDGETSKLYVLPRAEDAHILFSTSLSALAVGIERDERIYLLVLSLYDGEVLFEGMADEWSLDERLRVKCTFDDMKKHTRYRVYGYKDAQFCILEQSFACACAHTYIDDLTPYLFLEALVVGDLEEAKSYLKEDLAEDLDALLTYIGAVERVRRPPCGGAETDVGVVDGEGNGRVLSFMLEQGKIADVRVVRDKGDVSGHCPKR